MLYFSKLFISTRTLYLYIQELFEVKDVLLEEILTVGKCVFVLLRFILSSETRSCFLAQVALELVILLPQYP